MPNFIISHQTPSLLIKIKFPKKFDGVALCFGAMVPDFNGFIDIFTTLELRNISHSLLGLIIWTLPITLILTILFSRYISSWFAELGKNSKFLSNLRNYFGIDDFQYLKYKKFNSRFLLIASISAIIGGFTHLLLDLPSHEKIELFYPWLVLSYPETFSVPLIIFNTFNFGLREIVITQFTVIWIIEDIFFFISSLYLLRYIKKRKLISNWYKLSL